MQIENCGCEVGLVQHTKFLNLPGPDQSQAILAIAKQMNSSLWMIDPSKVDNFTLRELNKFFFKVFKSYPLLEKSK